MRIIPLLLTKYKIQTRRQKLHQLKCPEEETDETVIKYPISNAFRETYYLEEVCGHPVKHVPINAQCWIIDKPSRKHPSQRRRERITNKFWNKRYSVDFEDRKSHRHRVESRFWIRAFQEVSC